MSAPLREPRKRQIAMLYDAYTEVDGTQYPHIMDLVGASGDKNACFVNRTNAPLHDDDNNDIRVTYISEFGIRARIDEIAELVSDYGTKDSEVVADAIIRKLLGQDAADHIE